jgi:hypothetical protein
VGPERGTFLAGGSRCGITARGLVARFAGSGPPSESCVLTTRIAGSGLEPIVDGPERLLVQLGYGVLHAVHSERKFQSHPTVPPGRLRGG